MREAQLIALMAAIIRSQARHTAGEALREAEHLYTAAAKRTATRHTRAAKHERPNEDAEDD